MDSYVKYLNMAVSVLRDSGQIEQMEEGSRVTFSEQIKLIWKKQMEEGSRVTIYLENLFTSTFLCHFASVGVCSYVAKFTLNV